MSQKIILKNVLSDPTYCTMYTVHCTVYTCDITSKQT